MKFKLSSVVIATWLYLFGAQIAVAVDPARPNIILINIDDLGYADISPFGGKVPTPNLQQMSREGIRLRSHYAAPLCSPSRAAMLTGCYPKRVLPIQHVLFPASEVGLNPSEVTIAEVLKPAGYATACVGKWHLGDQAEFLPTRQGFDYYFGLPYSNDMGLSSEGAKSNPGSPRAQSQDKPAKRNAARAAQPDSTGLRGDQPPLPLLENENVVERVKSEQQHTLTRRYTEKAIHFIRQHQAQPFFLYLPHSAVHWPHYPHQEFIGKSNVSLQKDWVMEVDDSVGQILNCLRELKLESNTLVVFTSDNGGPIQQGADNAPLRGAKGSTWEGGMRVCTIAWWPGKIAPESSTNDITAHLDWLPTFASIAGASLPAGRKLDGVDISNVLFGKSGGHDVFYYFKGLDLEAVRERQWKLVLANQQLFDLDADVSEAENVAEQHPDIVKRLEEIAKGMSTDLGTKGANAPGVRELGRVANPEPLIFDDGRVRAGNDGFAKTLP